MSWLQTLCLHGSYSRLQEDEEERIDFCAALPPELPLLLFDDYLELPDLLQCLLVCKRWHSTIAESSMQYRAWSRVLQPMVDRIGIPKHLSPDQSGLALLLACRRGDVGVCDWIQRCYPESRSETLLMDCLQVAYSKRHYSVCSWLRSSFHLSDSTFFQSSARRFAYACNAAILQQLRDCSQPMLPELSQVDLLAEFRSCYPASALVSDKTEYEKKRTQILLLLRLYGTPLFEEYSFCIQGYCDEWDTCVALYDAARKGKHYDLCDRLLQLILEKYSSYCHVLGEVPYTLQKHGEYSVCTMVLHNARYLDHRWRRYCAHLLAMACTCSLECRRELADAHAAACVAVLPTHACCHGFLQLLITKPLLQQNKRAELSQIRWFYEQYGALLSQSSDCYDVKCSTLNHILTMHHTSFTCLETFFIAAYRHGSPSVIAALHEWFVIPEGSRAKLLHFALYTGQKQAASNLLSQVLEAHELDDSMAFQFAIRSPRSAMVSWLMEELGQTLCLTVKDLCVGLRRIEDYSLWTRILHQLTHSGLFYTSSQLYRCLWSLWKHDRHRAYEALLPVIAARLREERSVWSNMVHDLQHGLPRHNVTFLTHAPKNGEELYQDSVLYPDLRTKELLDSALCVLYEQHRVKKRAGIGVSLYTFEVDV